MDIEQLKAFVLVANTQSFTRSAELLNVVQSTVTARIQMLEKLLGKELFERDKRNIRLTDAGKVFLPYSERIIELCKEGIRSAQLEQEYTNHITIGTTHALWDYVLFDCVNIFQKNHDNILITMITEHSDIIIRKMIDGLIDIGIVFYPVTHSNITMEPILEDTFILVADPEFQMREKPLAPVDLRNLEYVHLNWGGTFSEWFQQSFYHHSTFHLEVDHVSLLLKFLKNRKGVGFIPNSVARRLIDQRLIVEVPFQTETPVPKRPIYLVKRKQENTVEFQILTDYIKRIFKE